MVLVIFITSVQEISMTNANKISSPYCFISDSIFNIVKSTQGEFFKTYQDLDPLEFTIDTLDPLRAIRSGKILQRITKLKDMKVLEIGSGCGVTHVTWTKMFGINGYAVEPEGEGFDNSAFVARNLLKENGLNPNRIISATGEELPFKNNMFDIVYSSNVLEHVKCPESVLREAIRVTKKGGRIQIICPNYMSYFDGHYSAFHPPIFSNKFFCWWLKYIYKKDPAFAKTIRTEINPLWVMRHVKILSQKSNIKLIGLGEDIFTERMREAKVDNLN